MKQIIIIHGGECLNKEELYRYLQTISCKPHEIKKSRRTGLQIRCKDTHEVIIPDMPNKYSADYGARKIWFERHFIYLNKEDTILIGRSLGASFLLKRLSENTFPKKITQLHLVATMLYSDKISGECLGQFVADANKVSAIETQAENIFLYHSKDDPIVPYRHSEKLAELLPKSIFLTFHDREHFNQETFPELLENINHYKN